MNEVFKGDGENKAAEKSAAQLNEETQCKDGCQGELSGLQVDVMEFQGMSMEEIFNQPMDLPENLDKMCRPAFEQQPKDKTWGRGFLDRMSQKAAAAQNLQVHLSPNYVEMGLEDPNTIFDRHFSSPKEEGLLAETNLHFARREHSVLTDLSLVQAEAADKYLIDPDLRSLVLPILRSSPEEYRNWYASGESKESSFFINKSEQLRDLRGQLKTPKQKAQFDAFMSFYTFNSMSRVSIEENEASEVANDSYAEMVKFMVETPEFMPPNRTFKTAEEKINWINQEIIPAVEEAKDATDLAKFLAEKIDGYYEIPEGKRKQLARNFIVWKQAEMVDNKFQIQKKEIDMYAGSSVLYQRVIREELRLASLLQEEFMTAEGLDGVLDILEYSEFVSADLYDEVKLFRDELVKSESEKRVLEEKNEETEIVFKAIDEARENKNFRQEVERATQARREGRSYEISLDSSGQDVDGQTEKIGSAVDSAELNGLVSTGEIDDHGFPIVSTAMSAQYKFSIDPKTGEMCDVRVPLNYRDKLSSKDPNGACMVSACIDGNLFGSAAKIQQEGKEKESAFAGFGDVGAILFADSELEISWARMIANTQKNLNKWGEDWSMVLGSGISSNGEINRIELSRNRVEILDRIQEIGAGDAEASKEKLMA